jgi:hypothetical protein
LISKPVRDGHIKGVEVKASVGRGITFRLEVNDNEYKTGY